MPCLASILTFLIQGLCLKFSFRHSPVLILRVAIFQLSAQHDAGIILHDGGDLLHFLVRSVFRRGVPHGFERIACIELERQHLAAQGEIALKGGLFPVLDQRDGGCSGGGIVAIRPVDLMSAHRGVEPVAFLKETVPCPGTRPALT